MKMSEFLFNPALSPLLNFIGVVLAAAALIPYIWGFFTKPKKVICASTLSILSLQPWANRKLQLTFADKIIENPSFVEIEIANSGNVDVPSNNFEEPLHIDLNIDAEILDFEVLETEPEMLKNYVILNMSSSHSLRMQPILFNKKSRVIVRFLANNYTFHTVSGLILGITTIKNIPLHSFAILKIPREKWSFLIASMSVVAFVIGNMVGQHGWLTFWKTVFGY
jgi:hypothetical protein